MSSVLYHLTEDGPKRCTASVRNCPLGGQHYETMKDAVEAHEVSMSSKVFKAVRKLSPAEDPKNGFSLDTYYGELPPREMQLDAMNGVAEALENEGNTQLVAACGTGKSYMGRQLMRRMMEGEDANGIAVVLTSSIKLAKDTASDLRPNDRGFYDHSLGEYGEDYRVIEVHSDSKEFLKNGVVSTDKIAEAWSKALAEGKKVVVVSTYESSSKVQEVQVKLLENGMNAEADLLMNDEAHNILGQQRSASATTVGLNSGYRSFHNEIPGSIQSQRRLYATATPVIREMVSDDNSTIEAYSSPEQEAERVEAMQAVANTMAAEPKARITVYSDDSAVVGRVGGYISQEKAIESKSLAEPDYQLREALIKGNAAHAKGGYVDASGTLMATPDPSKSNLSVQTYSALSATLNAMAADPKPGVNPVHNALAYCGSIDQAKAFRDNFKAVALEQSGGMDLATAENARDAADPDVRRRARMRLLAENANAQAAYSGEEAQVKKAREAAFSMFKNQSFTEEDAAKGWSPNKRVLANVDIFSEGVSINEIDTVVISDDEKTSERAMTQAIGRAIRRVPSNPFKATGHVIIPQARGANGEELNGGSVALAAYGATRVERGVAISKLRGETAKPDVTTKVTSYSPNGERQKVELAADIAKTHISSHDDVVTAHTLDRAHKELLKNEDGYKEKTASEQYAVMASYIAEKANSVTSTSKDAYWGKAHNHVSGKSVNQLNAIRQSNRVLVSALGANDTGSLSPELTKVFIEKKVLLPAGGKVAEPTLSEKRELIERNLPVVAAALASMNTKETHPELHSIVTTNVSALEVMKASKGRGKAEHLATAEQDLAAAMQDDSNLDKLYGFVSRSKAEKEKYSLLHDDELGKSFRSDRDAVIDTVKTRAASSVVDGNEKYELNRAMVRKIGDLTSSALIALS
jgi:superfamily II DNA or RNA helicase